MVDRLLASPHYGERWARPWLDLARYADSNGYEKDAPADDVDVSRLGDQGAQRRHAVRPVHHRAARRRHAAEATADQRIATGFHRNTLLNQEGGIDVEEARWETLVDRVNTTATVWLGSTIACAQCHNHKYDPFSQRDYYRLLAFFDNVEYTVFGKHGRRPLDPGAHARPADARARARRALLCAAELKTLNATSTAPDAEDDAGQACLGTAAMQRV